MAKIIHSTAGEDDRYYQMLGLTRDVIEPWEDGMRSKDEKGNYEWWYYDSHFSDGSIMVIVFYTKPMAGADGPMKPFATISLTMPDGTKYEDKVHADVSDCAFSKEQCDVRIGACRIVGDLKHYEITFQGEKMQASVTLDGTIPTWRAQTGCIFFGENDEHYFAWLPAVPEGVTVADASCGGKTFHLEGTGYHDHNWGNIFMPKLMHHWYWGRAKVGDYKLISSWITGQKKYGYKEFDVFMLTKGEKLLGDNRNHTLKFVPEGEYLDAHTGKPIYGTVAYEYTTPEGEEYRIRYERKRDISNNSFTEKMNPVAKLGAKLAGLDGAYVRFEGTATVERIENGQVAERVSAPAVWELMYFGRSGADKKK